MKGLDAVRARRLEVAHARATQVEHDAREESARLRSAALSEAEKLTWEAQLDGEASAEVETGRDWTAARRQARAIVLAAQKAAYDRLIADATAAVTADSRYPLLERHTVEGARRQLGPGADVQIDGSRIVATRRQRQVTWSVGEAVQQALASGVVDAEELWR